MPKKANFGLYSSTTTRGVNSFFESYNRLGCNYGVDQEFLENQFTEDMVTERKTGTEEYFR